ncbi:SGNH/GDSL hydrolase family protein [Ornithinimicrobium sp. F0845]|uniref:SGNH/GDSL hydrolase family protein n=1 Tax=Ornithinimicrobium sp. F0845 TaxID=2926412 RepID=UPI001FF18014|nr:SGNH/GDSL hydrolase family protein [Ornithinimicrobium sp. F0845]MCK0112256.1 SGNH/GDSL hydrolase family protein [Ornithinimicrobium sp. F0845]
MSRASRARRVAAAAAYGGGGMAAAGLAGLALLRAEVLIAKRIIGEGAGTPRPADGTYGAGFGEAHRILMLGDSTAAGVGATRSEETIGAIVATGVAALTGHPVELCNASRSGATSPQLLGQLEHGLTQMPEPDVAIIMIGANDVKERLDRAASVRALSETVTRLVELGVGVVVGTCPDLGTVRPIPQPLRALVQRWSRDLAAAQTVAVVEAGGRTVSTGDLLGPTFRESPTQMFSADGLHPSSAGYARAAAALLPSVVDALGLHTLDTGRIPDHRRGEHVEPLPEAAQRAVLDPGSEVSAVDVDGRSRGERGRWAQLLRRHRHPAPDETADDSPGSADTASHDSSDADDSGAARPGAIDADDSGAARPGASDANASGQVRADTPTSDDVDAGAAEHGSG